MAGSPGVGHCAETTSSAVSRGRDCHEWKGPRLQEGLHAGLQRCMPACLTAGVPGCRMPSSAPSLEFMHSTSLGPVHSANESGGGMQVNKVTCRSRQEEQEHRCSSAELDTCHTWNGGHKNSALPTKNATQMCTTRQDKHLPVKMQCNTLTGIRVAR